MKNGLNKGQCYTKHPIYARLFGNLYIAVPDQTETQAHILSCIDFIFNFSMKMLFNVCIQSTYEHNIIWAHVSL